MTAKDLEAVDAALDRYARKPVMRRLAKKVMRAQDALRKITSAKAWNAYLKVEEAVNERDFEMVAAAIRLARRHHRKPIR